MSKIEFISPIRGAAEYVAEKMGDGKYAIVMYPDGENTGSVIDKRSTYELARKCANRWQKKENAAVLKATL